MTNIFFLPLFFFIFKINIKKSRLCTLYRKENGRSSPMGISCGDCCNAICRQL